MVMLTLDEAVILSAGLVRLPMYWESDRELRHTIHGLMDRRLLALAKDPTDNHFILIQPTAAGREALARTRPWEYADSHR